jgi:DNA repair protein RadC
LKKIQVSKGGVTGTVADIRMIMKEAIDSLASAMVLCHNHPSGNSDPSGDDDNITLRLKEAGQIMDVRLLDHIIVCDHSYYSYMDRGRM